ncbi:MAG: ParB/RepB/Spo0J family partition protein [Gammaproteobacteria bacterium]
MESPVKKTPRKFKNTNESLLPEEITAKYVHPLEKENFDPLKIREIPLDLIEAGKYQPRRHFEEDELVELADSIMTHGVMQPILVRPTEDDRFELIAGERRWRASGLAHLKTIPAIVRNISDRDALALGLIENIQRSNLNPIEEGIAYKRLMDEFGMTHEKISETVGKSRASISNMLRLLKLPDCVQEALMDGRIQVGHGKALLGVPEEEIISTFEHAIQHQLTVRELEAYARRIGKGGEKVDKIIFKRIHPNQAIIEDLMFKLFDKKCDVRFSKDGFIKIPISSQDPADIIDKLKSLIALAKQSARS